jgi:hypothetical protein
LVYSAVFGFAILVVGCEIHRRYDMVYPKLLTSM